MATKICENCGKGELEIIETRPGHVIRRGFTGRKGPQYYKGTVKFLTEDCPSCGARRGKRRESHERKIARLKAAGIPLIIRSV
uniref:Uncharacterized protein n=1 Tax=viral metagenome TaxID=1070528 RepID=A0A6M3LBG2_9ZZZZ